MARNLYDVTFESPSAEKYSNEILDYLVTVDYSHLWMCLKDDVSHCGKCTKCVTFIKEIKTPGKYLYKSKSAIVLRDNLFKQYEKSSK